MRHAGSWHRAGTTISGDARDRGPLVARAAGGRPSLHRGAAGQGRPIQASGELRGKILDALIELDDPAVATIVLKAFPRLPDLLKPRAIELLTERPAWTKALLAAVADKTIPASALNITQLRKLQ